MNIHVALYTYMYMHVIHNYPKDYEDIVKLY